MRRAVTIGHIVLAAAAVAGLAAVVKWLWNALVPELFGLASLSLWQALGLFILCRLLFGGFGFVRFHFNRRRAEHFNHFQEKWSTMSPEERDEFVKRRHSHHFRRDFFNAPTAEKRE